MPPVSRLRELLKAAGLPTTGYTEKGEMMEALLQAGVRPDLLETPSDSAAAAAQAESAQAPAAAEPRSTGAAVIPPSVSAPSTATDATDAVEIVLATLERYGGKLIDGDVQTACDYALLGVPHHALPEHVRAAYRALCIGVHPDKSRHPRAAEAFGAVRESFERLARHTAPSHDGGTAGLPRGGGDVHTPARAHWARGWQAGAQMATTRWLPAAGASASAGASGFAGSTGHPGGVPTGGQEVELVFACAVRGCAGGPPPLGEGLVLRLPPASLSACLVSACPHCGVDVTLNVPDSQHGDTPAPSSHPPHRRAPTKRTRDGGTSKPASTLFELPASGCARADPSIGLPDGWWVHSVRCDRTVARAASGGASVGGGDGGAQKTVRFDKYYLCPDKGLRFRSLVEVRRYLASQPPQRMAE
jgi:hypothetical protein